MTSEEWRDVIGWEGLYLVSNHGRVQSVRSRIIMRPGFNPKNGKLQVTLGSPRRQRYVHHLVLESFIGPRPVGKEACHFNDIGTDNRVENLRWDTHSANKIDSVLNGIHHFSKRSKCSKGHQYTDENTYIEKRNGTLRRKCRQCRRERYAMKSEAQQ